MAATNRDSSLDLASGREPALSSPDPPFAVQDIWLNGGVLACACPECGAPMSIRLWLMVADCWRCGASIELSEEQERAALRLLREREALRRSDTLRAASAITPSMLRKPKPPTARERQPAPPLEAPPRRRRVASTQVAHGTRARIRDLYERGTLGILWRDLFKDLPAWLISLVVHLVALLLLGLWINNPPKPSESITLATSVGYEDLEGGNDEPDDPELDAFEFDDPGAIPLDELTALESPKQSEVSLESESFEPPDPIGILPPSANPSLTLPVATAGHMFAGRDPSLRAQIIQREGGTSYTEAAVARGLHWLARHQNADGSWSLDAWHRAPGAFGEGNGLGGHSDTAATALALLPFLGAGQTHYKGEYSDTVLNGLRWLVEHQGEDGDLRGRGIGRLYAHGQATIALCEAFALTGDEQLQVPAQAALDYIVRAQHSAGGWRYEPGQPGDTSVVGWQLMALRSGKMAYLRVPQNVFQQADRFLDSVATDRYRSQYAYQPNRGTSHVMTAEALLCRQYLGWPKEHEGLELGVQYLLDDHPPNGRLPNIYYWYYATQVMHHMGGAAWSKWNYKIRSILVDMQEKRGPMAGSWTPRGGHSGRGGRIYMTALAVCTLEVYYRYLPMYRPDIVQEYRHSAEQHGSE